MKAVVTRGMRRRLAGINHREVKTTALIFADIRKRLRGYYREDIIKLQNLIDWDLNVRLKNGSAPRFNPRLDNDPLHG